MLDFQMDVVATTTDGRPYTTTLTASIPVGGPGAFIRYEEHFLLDPDIAGASGRLNFTDAWVSSATNRVMNTDTAVLQPDCTASPPFHHDSDGDGWQGQIDRSNWTYHIFDLTGVFVDVWIHWEYDPGYVDSTWSFTMDYTDDGGTNWYPIWTDNGTGAHTNWSCIAGSLYQTIALTYPGTEDLIFDNPNFGWRFTTSGVGNPAPALLMDNLIIQGDSYVCTASPCTGACVTGAPWPIPVGQTALKAGADLDVTWNAVMCPTSDYNILYGPLAGVGTYTLTGAECNIGTSGNYLWPAAPTDIYYLIVGVDGGFESSWGTDSAGTERNGFSGMCGLTGKDELTNPTCP
jgi:hypothetical protein